jgi:4-hydroxybenzoate polyprenyltransferase/phosphoserine phosphatase
LDATTKEQGAALEQAGQASVPKGPIVVDMDDTLLQTDTLLESIFQLVAQHPLQALLLPFWLLRGGRAGLKRSVAEHVLLDIDTLPVNEGLLEWLQGCHDQGHVLHLFSAADQAVVTAVAARFGLFETARGSDGVTNLSGPAKLAAIQAQVGRRFVYAGDSRKDLPVWEGGGTALLVGNVARLRSGLPASVAVDGSFPVARLNWRVWARALRVHQWAKNTLLFVAVLLGGDIVATLPGAILGFVIFGLVASMTYLLNDMLDLPHDRRHRSKRHRPLASGQLPLRTGMLAMGGMGLAACMLLPLLPAAFAMVTALYLVVTLAYSLHVKRRLMLDVFTLAGLFTIRIGAGIAVVGHPVSPWLIAFSMFFFLSLAALKRYSECVMMVAEGIEAAPGRAYRPVDAPWLMAMGAGAAFSAMSTFFLFLVDAGSPVSGYAHPHWMWLICVILGYWICRAWALAPRGLMNDDPVLFALRDRLSLTLAGVTALLMLLARG